LSGIRDERLIVVLEVVVVVVAYMNHVTSNTVQWKAEFEVTSGNIIEGLPLYHSYLVLPTSVFGSCFHNFNSCAREEINYFSP
jgi:hypothetical protein